MELLTTIAVVGIPIFLFVLFSKWRYRYWTRNGVPQLEPKLFFGDFKPLLTGALGLHDYFRNIYNESKAKGWKHVGIYNIIRTEYMPLDLNVAKRILTKDFAYFPGHGSYHHECEPLTQNLFGIEGEAWKKLRTKLTPTFTTGKMKMMFETLMEKADVLTKVLNQKASSTQEIPIKETMARFSTDVIGSVAFGIECNSMEEPDNKLRSIGKKVFEPNLLRFLIEEMLPHNIVSKLGHKSIPHDVTTYFTEVVTETIEYRKKNKVERKDFIQLMLQTKDQANKANSFTDQEIITESFLFYIAGFETSSSTTAFALLELSKDQAIQEKLRDEIHDVLARNNGKMCYQALIEMEYLDKVMRETLRKYPPVPFIPRKCSKRYNIPDSNVVIEIGTRVYIPAWGIQMDPEYYPNPEEFNPENFSPENKSRRSDFTWIPFGEGPRMCIGLRFGMMQSKIGLITLLKDFTFSPHEKTKWPLVMDKGTILLTLKGDIWLKIKKL